MAFQRGNNFGSLGKRGKSKINKELRDYLETLTFETLKQIDVSKLTNSERLKFINYSLPYLLNRLQSVEVTDNDGGSFKPVVIHFENK